MTDKQKVLLDEYLKLQDEGLRDLRPMQDWCDFVNKQSSDDLGVILPEAMKAHKAERLKYVLSN